MSKKLIPTLSLFSGAGGLDLGFVEAGFDIVACVEIEAAYCETLKLNQAEHSTFGKKTHIHCEDIRDFDAGQYANAGIRCIIGGPPCQTFSAAGRRSGGVIGTEDERGQLFKAYCRILKEINPEVFVFENVYGLPGANGGEPWREIVSAFRELGYSLSFEVVDAADYGTPQHRERLIMVGHRNSKYSFPEPTHGPDSRMGEPLVSVFQAIKDLQPKNEPYGNDLGGMYGHLLPLVPEGLNYSFFTTEMGHPEPVFAWRSKFHDLLYKVCKDEPCRTIKAQPGKFTGPFHWKNRHFTNAELKRLQTFPDSYVLVGSRGKVMQQIGNSVPPKLASAIAISVREQLFDRTNERTHFDRSADFKSTFRSRQRARSSKFSKIAKKAIEVQYGSKSVGDHKLIGTKEFDSYYLIANGLFERKKYKTRPRERDESRRYQVKVKDASRHISIDVDLLFNDSNILETNDEKSSVYISGLSKYLPNYDTLEVNARVQKTVDVFHIWSIVEECLVERSRFFTLIDIYGHYANRGDTVDVRSCWNLDEDVSIVALLNKFGNTANCGMFINQHSVFDDLGVDIGNVAECITNMRRIRFDMRTSDTHPIIDSDAVICTYPFPLLSPRALVESRVQFVGENKTANANLSVEVAVSQ